MIKRFISLFILFAFVSSMVCPQGKVYAQGVSELPAPGAMISLSQAFEPLLIKGLKVHPENPFLFDFILDPGNDVKAMNERPYLQEQSKKLIKYFLAAMTVPEKDLWVNLSPYEKDRMIPENLGQTEMGRDMLAQDYILKQLTASLIYPEKHLGKIFWDKVYAKAQQQFGTTDIPVNTFNKVWIVAERADVFEHGQTAFIVGSHLKVMLEEDYKALIKHGKSVEPRNSHSLSSQIIREVILPELEKEVNQGANFAPLRQMFYSMVLASWYKMALKDALLTQVYGNQSKVKVGVNAGDPAEKDKIFQRYLQAYKKGVFNYIKEDVNKDTQTTISRKYFSGGWNVFPGGDPRKVIREVQSLPAGDQLPGNVFLERVPVSIPAASALNAAKAMINIMNVEQEQAIEDGKLEVGIAIQGLGLEGKPGAAEEMADLTADYRSRPGAIFKKARYLQAYPVPDGIHNFGNVPGVMPLAEKILADLAPTPMSEADIKAGKVRLNVIALESGGGTRSASLTVNAGNKGEIILYGRTLLEQGIQQVKALAYGLPPGEYFVVTPCDNILLPRADISKQYSERKGFYLYAKETPALGEGLEEQLRLTELGQMLLDKEGMVKDNGFVEKPGLWELNYKIFANSLEKAYEDVSQRKAVVAEIVKHAASPSLLRSYLDSAGDDLAEQLLPFVVKKDVWNYEGQTATQQKKELYGTRPDKFKGMRRDEWQKVQQDAQDIMQAVPGVALMVKEILDRGGRFTYANTFYFTIKRDVMEKMVQLYSQPTEKNNGSYWARNLEAGKGPINGIPDWSGHILTPMSFANDDSGKKIWKDKYWDAAREALKKAKVKAAQKRLTVDTEDIKIWAERATTYTEKDWENLFFLAQEVKKMAGGMVGVNFGPEFADAGSPAEAKRILDEGTAQGPKRDLYNGLFGRPVEGDVAPDVSIEGNVSYTGAHFIRHSMIKVPEGVELVIGNNVRIEDTYLDIKAPVGVNKIVIEDGVVIVSSDVTGEVGKISKNVYVNEVHTNKGIGATTEGEVLGTLFDTKGQIIMTRHPLYVDIKDLRDKQTKLTDEYTWDDLIGDLENMVPKLIDRKRIRAERKALQVKIDKELAFAGVKPYVSSPITEQDIKEGRITFAMRKPDAAKHEREIFKDIEAGFEVAAFMTIKQGTYSREHWENFYGQLRSQPWFNNLIDYMMSPGGVTLMVLRKGPNTVGDFRKVLGGWDGSQPGTIRNKYGVEDGFGYEKLMNKVHASDSPERVLVESNMMFPSSAKAKIFTPGALKMVNQQAMKGSHFITQPSVAPVGGIDLNRANMQMNIKKEGSGVQMQFNRAMINRIKDEGFEGLEFKIESIVPITNLSQFIGMSMK